MSKLLKPFRARKPLDDSKMREGDQCVFGTVAARDCGRASKHTKGSAQFSSITEAAPPPFMYYPHF